MDPAEKEFFLGDTAVKVIVHREFDYKRVLKPCSSVEVHVCPSVIQPADSFDAGHGKIMVAPEFTIWRIGDRRFESLHGSVAKENKCDDAAKAVVQVLDVDASIDEIANGLRHLLREIAVAKIPSATGREKPEIIKIDSEPKKCPTYSAFPSLSPPRTLVPAQTPTPLPSPMSGSFPKRISWSSLSLDALPEKVVVTPATTSTFDWDPPTRFERIRQRLLWTIWIPERNEGDNKNEDKLNGKEDETEAGKPVNWFHTLFTCYGKRKLAR